MSWEQITIDDNKNGFTYVHFSENKQEFCETILSFLHNLKQNKPEKFKTLNVDLNELENYCSGLITDTKSEDKIHPAFKSEKSDSQIITDSMSDIKVTTSSKSKEETKESDSTSLKEKSTIEDDATSVPTLIPPPVEEVTDTKIEKPTIEGEVATATTLIPPPVEEVVEVTDTKIEKSSEPSEKISPVQDIAKKGKSFFGFLSRKRLLSPFSKKSKGPLEDYLQIKLSSDKIALYSFYKYLKHLGQKERGHLQRELETIIKEINYHLKKNSHPEVAKKALKALEVNISVLKNPDEITAFYKKVVPKKNSTDQGGGGKVEELIAEYTPLYRDLQLKEQQLKNAEEEYNLAFVNAQGVKDTTAQNMKIKAQREVSGVKKETDKKLHDILGELKTLKDKKIKTLSSGDSDSELKIKHWVDLPSITKSEKGEFGVKNMSLSYGKKTSVTLKLTFNKHHSIHAEIYQNNELLKSTDIIIPKLIVVMNIAHSNPFMTPFFTRVKNNTSNYKDFIKKTLERVKINHDVNVRVSAYTPDQRLYVQYLDRLKETERMMVYVGNFEFTGGQISGNALGWTIGFTHNVGNLHQLGKIAESKYSEYLVSPVKKNGSIKLERGNPVFGS